jgi:tricorn protease
MHVPKLRNLWLPAAVLCGGLLGAAAADAPPGHIDARMMRYPDVSATQIAFVYAGDIWLVPKTGGTAVRLTSPRGEESFPRFSPDGATLAFSGNYDGNQDIYTVPAVGGLPKRITHHGAPDRVVGWHPSGREILYATSMTSQKDRFNQLYLISAAGGLPRQLPIPYGEFGAISPDGKTLAYTPISVDFRTWKRYRGGMNPDIWFFDLEKQTAKNVTHNNAANSIPMWHGATLYFLSDRDEGKRANLWACDTKKDKFRQVTFFTDYDVHFPSIGPGDIVFEQGGKLHLLNLATEKTASVDIRVVTDHATLKPRSQGVSGLIQNFTISPTGKRALFEARGDIFSVPQENGIVRNETKTSGVAERYPAWSPDGKWIAYFSDRTGEYELTLRPADGKGEEQTLTSLGAGYRYQPQWSPDSKKIAFIDKAMKVIVHDIEAKKTAEIDFQKWRYHGDLQRFNVSWSSDSRWLAYSLDMDNRQSAIALYDLKNNQRHQVTSGFYEDDQPVFVPGGQYLLYRSARTFSPIYGDVDSTWVYPNSQQLVVVPLRKDVASPLAPRNDEEEVKKDTEKKAEPRKDEEKKPADAAVAQPAAKKDEAKPAPATASTNAVEIDLEGFEQRAVILPTKAGRYDNLAAVKGKLLFRWLPRTGSDGDTSLIEYWDLEDRKVKRVVDDGGSFEVSANGLKLIVSRNGYSIIDVKEGQNLNKKLATGGFEATIDPVLEWKQLFNDAWRLQRDLFYDPGLHGVDWNEMRRRYAKLLDDAVTRWDVNYVIGELIGELNSSHTYRSGGDTENSPQRGVGYLGCDFTLENGAYRIQRIVTSAVWDAEVRSSLKQPGVNVKEGDYLLAVNGTSLDTTQDPWAAFQGLAGTTVMLTVNDKPQKEGSREVLVQTLSSEARLRHLAWIESNRQRVEKASDGKIGYVYVPDTGVNGQNELMRQFRAQIDKPGLVIDERFNSGGQIPDRFVELLNRPVKNYWAVRDGVDWQWPQVTHAGPKAMLINGWSGSGGDCFPYYFKQAGLGPLVGTRTWGGLIGMTGAPGLIDGGSVTVPTFGIYNLKGEWIIEGYGVDPDIRVVDDPALMAKGKDPQLDRAVEEVLKSLKKNPPPTARKPKYPNRAN